MIGGLTDYPKAAENLELPMSTCQLYMSRLGLICFRSEVFRLRSVVLVFFGEAVVVSSSSVEYLFTYCRRVMKYRLPLTFLTAHEA